MVCLALLDSHYFFYFLDLIFLWNPDARVLPDGITELRWLRGRRCKFAPPRCPQFDWFHISCRSRHGQRSWTTSSRGKRIRHHREWAALWLLSYTIFSSPSCNSSGRFDIPRSPHMDILSDPPHHVRSVNWLIFLGCADPPFLLAIALTHTHCMISTISIDLPCCYPIYIWQNEQSIIYGSVLFTPILPNGGLDPHLIQPTIIL